MALRGRMNLSSYDRLFPSQDVLQTGGPGNLIAAPLSGKARRRGTTLFLDLATLEPHEDQWATCPRSAESRHEAQTDWLAASGRCTSALASTDSGPRPPPVQVPHTVKAQLGAAITVGTPTPPPAPGDVETRGNDAEPGVLRTAAAARVHMGHPAVPAELRRNRDRRPSAAAWSAGPSRATHRASGKQTGTDRRSDRRDVARVRIDSHPGS